jgi:hypothetical protein
MEDPMIDRLKEEIQDVPQCQNLPPRAYHITQGAIDICNGLGMQPADVIVWQAGELRRKTETRDLSVQLEDAFRKVAQAEGVMLHVTQKEFFRELTASLLAAIKKEFDGDES